MLPLVRRGLLAVALVVLLVPGTAAQPPPTHDLPSPEAPERPSQSPPDVTPYDPDLYPTSVSVFARDARTNTTVCVNIQDIAQPPTQDVAGQPERLQQENPIDPFWVKFSVFIERENDTPTLWAEASQQQTKPMQPGAQATVTLCSEFPLSGGDYSANVLVDSEHDVAESREDNNVRTHNTGFSVALSPLPDLRILRMSVSPSPAGDGRQVGVKATIINDGGAPSLETTVRFKDDGGFDRTFAVRALQAHQTVDVATAFLANDHPAGAYRMVASVDPDDRIKEYAIENNEANATFVILAHPAPDLLVTDATVNGSLLAHRGLRLDANVTNLGNRTSNATTLRLFVDGRVLSNATIPLLGANANASAEFFLFLDVGAHSLRLVVDPDLGVAELDETNNDRKLDLTIREPDKEETLPNLVVQRLSAAPDDPAPNETVTVTAIVGNLGQGRSNATLVQFEVGGVVIGRAKLGEIASGRSASVSFAWPVHDPAPYALRARADPDENITELDDSDNALTLFLTILPPPEPQAPPTDELGGDGVPDPGTGGPTPPTPPTTPSPPSTASPTGVDLTKVVVSTRPVSGGVKGIVSAALRNPSFDALGRVIVTFRVDGSTVKEQLVNSIAAAGVSSATTGEIDLPPGNHTISVEARVVGSNLPSASVTQTYDTLPGSKGVPAPTSALALAAALVAAAIVTRRRR